MRELINLIPFLDIAIVALVLFFLYLGWNHGVPRLAMVVGAIYTGFLLAAIYYHLFAVAMANLFRIRFSFVTDLVAFLVLDALITLLMLGLLFSLFGHVEIRGRAAVFDKIGGSILGFLAGVLVVGILVTLLRVPYEANRGNINAQRDMPVVLVFNRGYEKSTLAPYFVQTAPVLMASVVPLLPPETQARGAIPLLESIVAQK